MYEDYGRLRAVAFISTIVLVLVALSYILSCFKRAWLGGPVEFDGQGQ